MIGGREGVFGLVIGVVWALVLRLLWLVLKLVLGLSVFCVHGRIWAGGFFVACLLTEGGSEGRERLKGGKCVVFLCCVCVVGERGE